MDDVSLVGRYQAGSTAAFAELYRRHAPAVAAVCRARLRDPELAQEAVQEVFVKALSGLLTFDCRRPVEHWLRRVAKNHCMDVHRGRSRDLARTHGSDQLLDVPDPHGERPFETVAARSALSRVLHSLNGRDRELLVRRHIEGVSVDALAARAGMTRGAMAVALNRARTRARERSSRDLLGLGALLGWWRMRRSVLDRAPGTELMIPGAQLAAAQVGLAILLTVPSLLELPGSETTMSMLSPATVITEQAAGRDVDVPPLPASPLKLPPSPSTAADDSIVEPVDSLDLAGVPVRVSQHPPPGGERRRYGVQPAVVPEQLHPRVDWYSEPETRNVGTVACAAFEMAAPTTYCED